MKTILSWSRRQHMARVGIFFIAAALVVGMICCAAPDGGDGNGQTYTLHAVSSGGGYVTTPAQQVSTYAKGEVVSLVATPYGDNQFDYWSGDVNTIADVNAATTTITMNGDYFITANFLFGSGEEEEEEEIDMEDAISIVVDDILPDIPGIQAGDPYVCIKLDSPLPQGTIIEEYSGDTLITLDEEKFFFYLDLAPGAFYAHDVKYILVDKNGDPEIYDAEWWVLIDDEIPEELAPDYADELYVIATNIAHEEHEAEPWVFSFPDLLPSYDCEGFIVVQGLMQNEKLYDAAVDDANNRYQFFLEYAAKQAEGCSQLAGLAQSQALNVFDAIDSFASQGLNPITISIIAHGKIDRIKLGGQRVPVSDFRSKMAQHPLTTFNFLLTSCHSGSFIDDLSTLDNVHVVATACRDDEAAYPDHDGMWAFHQGDDCMEGSAIGMGDCNPQDSGGEWMSSLLEAMSQIVEDEAEFEEIRVMAEAWHIPVTSLLITAGFWRALGEELYFQHDLDLCHRYEWEHPQLYTSWGGYQSS